MLSQARLAALVTAAVELDREIARKEEELKALKARLIDEALARPGELEKLGLGQRWLAEGADGSVARVNFPAPSIAKLEAAAPQCQAVLQLVGKHVKTLLEARLTYHAVKSFRDLLPVVLSRAAAKKVLELVEQPGSPRVSFETKESRKAA